MAQQQTERETKYEVGPTFVMPELKDLIPAGGRVEVATVALESVYYDTAEHDLLAHGVTLRNRAGEVDAGWQLKIPDGSLDKHARTEIRLDPTESRRDIPDELLSMTAGLRRGADLRHIATIRTHRGIRRVLDRNDNVVVEVADDQVHSSAPSPDGALLQEWREIEAELGAAASSKVLSAIDKKLTNVGATPSPSANKVVHALNGGDRSETPSPKGAKTAGEIIRQYIQQQDDALIAGDLTLRRGLGGIHPTRVATRRLRSTLRIYAALFDAGQAAGFDAELSWYADLLGEVRDREVQRERMKKLLADVPDELVLGPVEARIEQRLLSEQLQKQRQLDEALNSPRYFALLQASRRWATTPPFTDLAGEKSDTVARYLRKGEKKLTKHLAAGLGANGGDEELHKARKAGKRARYAAELSTPVLGQKKAKKLVSKYQLLQDTLGDHQDGVVAAELLRRLATATAGSPDENGFTYGLLYAQELHRAKTSRKQAKIQHSKMSG